MKERRWLLPFTHELNEQALNLICQMAQEVKATLVAVSLLAPKPDKGIQIEQIRGSKNFQTSVRSHARKYGVVAEQHEIWVATGDNVPTRIQTLVRDYQCDSLVVIVKQGQGVLLQTDEITTLIVHPPASLVLLRLPESQRQVPQKSVRILRKYLAFLRRLCMRIYIPRPILKIEEGEKIGEDVDVRSSL